GPLPEQLGHRRGGDRAGGALLQHQRRRVVPPAQQRLVVGLPEFTQVDPLAAQQAVAVRDRRVGGGETWHGGHPARRRAETRSSSGAAGCTVSRPPSPPRGFRLPSSDLDTVPANPTTTEPDALEQERTHL